MPILVKSDDVRRGRKAKVRHGRLRAAQASQRVNQEGTFGNQEGMITWCGLAEHACIKLVSRLKRSLKKEFQKRIASEFDLNTVISS